ncbi:hypothetical protein KFK09_021388 [Dendrobium nobile]|uniref:Reticulon-like protein n=1 Tax=Dendrobium nobile TaxID=94219 RepID=A0A8T3APQ6_DENNO|nr:hypothetical protein KFK09_021388 [Dendrobium nobile]
MSEDVGHAFLYEEIHDKIHEYKRPSSSSESDKDEPSIPVGRKKRLFERKEPVHTILGGGKSADIILWRNKHISGGILASVTVIWLLFEWVGYHLLTFICHSLMLFLAALFLWSNAASFLNRNPPKFLEVILSEELFLTVAQAVRFQINDAYATFRFVASGKDLKTFLMRQYRINKNLNKALTIVLTPVFTIICTLPALYDKYEDNVDAAVEKAIVHIKKQYAVLDEKLLQKIPRGSLPDKKRY